MVKINPDWWKTIFDETYLITDARSVCDNELTYREVDFIEQVLNLEKSSSILDLCGGQGRHSLELSKRGFEDVTVLDYSSFLINLGRQRAMRERLNTKFIQSDARDTGLPNQRYRFIIIMASSFGYFLDEKEDRKILCEVFRLLTPGGSLLLDLPDREYVLKNFSPQLWHEANKDIIVCRKRRLDRDMIFGREIVISKIEGLIRDETYCTRLYSQERISELLRSVGFSSITTQKGFVSHKKKEDYGCMTNRIIVIARTPAS
jgi:D-alanine-D-alanine ligase